MGVCLVICGLTQAASKSELVSVQAQLSTVQSQCDALQLLNERLQQEIDETLVCVCTMCM